MAIVGLTSPFKKSSKGSSPLKILPYVQAGIAVLGFLGARKEKKRARRREAEARAELERGR
tara:strand:- start:310 stop:492 length:183 start_codon:yes stop_codon:yes gene_type:complete